MSVNIYDKANDRLNLISGGTLFADAPIGVIQAYGGTTAPSGWLLCQGQAVSRTTYAELFTIIGTAFGAGDGSTTFNVPDLREATTKGIGLSGKSDNHYDSDGVTLGEFVPDRIKSHAHHVYVRDAGHAHTLPQAYGAFPAGGQFLTPYNASPYNVGTETGYANIQVSSKANFGEIDNATTGYGYSTNEVKAVGVNYIIKAKQVAMPADIQSAIEEQNSYSTEETYTGKRWIDGKKIYRRVYKCTAATTMAFGDEWKSISGWDIDASNMAVITHLFGSTYYWGRIDWTMQSNKMLWACLNSTITVPVDAALTIEYTKITD